MSFESGDEDATNSKEHLEGVDPFLGPVLDPFVAVRHIPQFGNQITSLLPIIYTC